ncbi:MAG: alpha/beta hydrolase [Breznakia sp.]
MNVTKEMIHPELRKKARLIRMIVPYFKPSTLVKANKVAKLMSLRSNKKIQLQQIHIKRENTSSLRLCVYMPMKRKENVTGILWIHGGGYAFGCPEQDVKFIKGFVLEHDCVVISPDYTLSIEEPYPAALEDCYAALLWMKQNAQKYSIRLDQLMVGGESAGGGLAAALSIYARDKEEVAIAFQMPLYPMLDDRMMTASSQNNDAPVWNTKSNAHAWKMYLASLYEANHISSYAAPARLKNFRNLPPALTYVGSIDPFKDETILYMENLKTAGIPVNYKIFEGCYHGFDIIASKSTPAKAAKKFLMENFVYAKKTYFAEQKSQKKVIIKRKRVRKAEKKVSGI